jgi:hypothetical protein
LDAIQPTSITGLAVSANIDGSDRDLAVVFANVDWSDRGIYRFGMWVGEPSVLAGVPFMARGYGINVNDQMCDTNGTTEGAGQARAGYDFFVTSGARIGLAGSYVYNNLSTNNQTNICGDSGGPDHANLGNEDFVWTHLIGVHSTGRNVGTPVQSSVPGLFVQNVLGGSYLSSDVNRDLDLAQFSKFGLKWYGLVAKTDTRATRMTYDPQTQRISGGGSCMMQSGSSVVPATCGSLTNPNAQRWVFSAQRTLKNVASGQCLTTSGGSPTAQACSTLTVDIELQQAWAFHPQR